ncbi:MAG: nucleoside-diphosphate kinase [Candidatus Levybacteria bacterium RIFCSPHIGHO2_02_FULL_40_18]|nr:MAG: nucleoside-diphosphate kinase [Candidatus Levybacteria bacterium RIFCSPHIGHO2_01_FULL_40_58]OGH26838.1 MAG: nucleoside-diphosphate kinase [Candidatus Levybacteria bacterium RIFCSPHIGHO2_02_FULL_40_18]OGH31197.1 MAG: nucleoside-diphosphate kinase [Candidatus Levybacteria bacterium RIFCSPHIGHO2_12_FULL_40_31]OGH39879.1 MAG: nucleoside-diphosphate kinase [Candidatus Levybacteria bacterium RIFCSPLOWO2_01_FULL_40_64]OGH48903.1 MAG: nucleoside-diphosphate kinase [Candidatus Levybacteria bacte
MVEQTVVLIKPDGVKRGLIGEIIHRFERMGLKIVAMKMIIPTQEILHEHYGTHKEETIERLGKKTLASYERFGRDAKKELGTDSPKELGKMVVEWLLNYVSSGPVIAMVVEGRHAVENVTRLAGPTMPVEATPGTIRGDFSTDSAAYANVEKRGVSNLIHVSGSIEEANFEKNLWFKPEEILSYKRADEGI